MVAVAASSGSSPAADIARSAASQARSASPSFTNNDDVIRYACTNNSADHTPWTASSRPGNTRTNCP